MAQLWIDFGLEFEELSTTAHTENTLFVRKPVDSWASANRLDGHIDPPHRFAPTKVDESLFSLDLTRGQIRTIIWATGYGPEYAWLDVPILDRKGQIRHKAAWWRRPAVCSSSADASPRSSLAPAATPAII